jgi:hypothetical protein
MARSIDYRSVSPYPAVDLYATMVDPEFLRTRLRRMGGPGAELMEHRADAEGARYRLRHGLAADELPPVVRTILSGDIVIERVETLTRTDAGHYTGDVSVTIRGVPADAAGRIRLANHGEGSEFLVRADVSVRLPLIGARVEVIIAEQVRNLLAAETAFTLDYLRS